MQKELKNSNIGFKGFIVIYRDLPVLRLFCLLIMIPYCIHVFSSRDVTTVLYTWKGGD